MPTETSTLALNSGELHKHHIDKRADRLTTEIARDGDPDELLSTSELAELTDLSVPFYEIGRSKGYGPMFVRLSPRRVRYRRGDVVAWLRERTYSSSAAYRDPAKPQGRKPGSKIIDGRVVAPAERDDAV